MLHACVQTHKTGSTTLGAALFRFGARYHKARETARARRRAHACAGCALVLLTLRRPLLLHIPQRFYCQGRPPNACRKGHILAPGRPLPPGQVYDLQLNHLSGNGHLRGTFGSVIGWYKARDTRLRTPAARVRRVQARLRLLCAVPAGDARHRGKDAVAAQRASVAAAVGAHHARA